MGDPFSIQHRLREALDATRAFVPPAREAFDDPAVADECFDAIRSVYVHMLGGMPLYALTRCALRHVKTRCGELVPGATEQARNAAGVLHDLAGAFLARAEGEAAVETWCARVRARTGASTEAPVAS